MSDLRLQPISQTDPRVISELMEAEERSWQHELDWDYSPIRRILESFIARRILPGYTALCGDRAFGYTYFLIQKDRAVIGDLYAPRMHAPDVADPLLTLTLKGLKDSRNIRRIEAQILPLNGIDFHTLFVRHGFEDYMREYLELELSRLEGRSQPSSSFRIESWNPGHLIFAADAAFRSYRGEVDAEICEDYRTVSGCEGYLRSLVEHPGCGVFLPEASLACLDSQNGLCGFILASRISGTSAMIPQISIAPSHQGLGIGTSLILCSLDRMRAQGYRTVRLTVTRSNRRAYEWYLRLGFVPRRTFSAYVWQR